MIVRVKLNNTMVNGESCARFLAANRSAIEEAMACAVDGRLQEMADQMVTELLVGTGEGEPKGLLSSSDIEPI